MSSGALRVDHPGESITRLTISNPDKRGALDHAILDGIAEVLENLESRCVIITGEPGRFSAGYDIGDIPEDVFEERAEALVAHPFTRALDALEAHPYPTIAALGGDAIGGGLELAITCDMRLAADGIRLGMPPARLGLVYSHVGLQRFIETVGLPRTRELFLRARNIDAGTALGWGLVHEVHDRHSLPDAALELAVELAAGAPLSLTGNKRVLRELVAARRALAPELERELIELRRACFASADMREGIRAFGEKRPPRWHGR